MSNYFIDAIEVSILDDDTGEVHILSLFYDKGENGFIRTSPPPTPLDDELEKQLDSIWKIAYE